jgi:hypothetical protein
MNNKTQIDIKRFDFNSFDDKALGWTCIELTIQKIQGKNITIKSQVYTQLTSGQKSLLLFWILYGHTRSGIIRFFDEVDYFLVNTHIWIEFKDRFKLFDSKDLLDLVMELESFYSIHIKKNRQKIFDNNTVSQLAIKLDKKINDIMPDLFKRIAEYIRDNPKDFVNFND